MLITTEARPATSAPMKDMGETIQRLVSAAEIQAQMAAVAQHFGAQEKTQQDDAATDLKSQNSTLRGGAKETSSELAEPHIVISTPAGLELSSAQSTHIASERHTAITSGKSLSIASVDGLFASVGKTLRLFVHQAGMKLIAAGGKVSMQAQSDDIEVIANKVLTMLSETDWVEIRGKKGVRLHGTNNMLEIGDKVQFYTSSPVLFNGNLETLAVKSATQSFNERPGDCRFDQEVNFLNVDGEPAADISYELVREDGAAINQKSAADGSTGVQNGTWMDSYTVRWKGTLP
jgi:type VI secretion system secreted protein VgrG